MWLLHAHMFMKATFNHWGLISVFCIYLDFYFCVGEDGGLFPVSCVQTWTRCQTSAPGPWRPSWLCSIPCHRWGRRWPPWWGPCWGRARQPWTRERRHKQEDKVRIRCVTSACVCARVCVSSPTSLYFLLWVRRGPTARITSTARSPLRNLMDNSAAWIHRRTSQTDMKVINILKMVLNPTELSHVNIT